MTKGTWPIGPADAQPPPHCQLRGERGTRRAGAPSPSPSSGRQSRRPGVDFIASLDLLAALGQRNKAGLSAHHAPSLLSRQRGVLMPDAQARLPSEAPAAYPCASEQTRRGEGPLFNAVLPLISPPDSLERAAERSAADAGQPVRVSPDASSCVNARSFIGFVSLCSSTLGFKGCGNSVRSLDHRRRRPQHALPACDRTNSEF